MHKSILILGPTEEARMHMAVKIADEMGTFTTTTAHELMQPFGMSAVMTDALETLIVAGHREGVAKHRVYAKRLGRMDNVMVEHKGKDPILVATPNMIYVSDRPLDSSLSRMHFDTVILA